jgi:hypothetical protein
VLALGCLGATDSSGSCPHSPPAKGKEQLWSSLQQTNGDSDVYRQNNVWAPGGSGGRHSHPVSNQLSVSDLAITHSSRARDRATMLKEEKCVYRCQSCEMDAITHWRCQRTREPH